MDGDADKGGHGRPYRTDAATGARHLTVDDAALDLVLAATEDGDDGVIRTLLRGLVALGLTSAASYWSCAAQEQPSDAPAWVQRRGYGGPTPPPQLGPPGPGADQLRPSLSASLYGSQSGSPAWDQALSSNAPLSFWLGSGGAIVALRESFDADGQRDAREEELESLVLLAETLLVDSHDNPASHIGETDDPLGAPGPLPRGLPDSGKGRQAG